MEYGIAAGISGGAYTQIGTVEKRLGVAQLTDGTVNNLHQALSMLDTLLERLTGPAPPAPGANGSAGPASMGVLNLLEVAHSLSGDINMRLHRLSDLI